MADQVVLPAGMFMDSSLDIPMPEPLSLLSLERVWLGASHAEADDDGTGVFGPGWWSWIDLRIVDGELVRPAPALPVSELRANGQVSFADGSKISWEDGTVVGACPAQGFCVDVERADDAVVLSAVGSDRTVRLNLADGAVVAATSSDGRSVEYRYADGMLSAVEGLPSSAAEYGYEGGALVSVADRLGERHVSYQDGRVSRLVDRDGDTWTFEFADGGDSAAVTVDRASAASIVHEFSGRWLQRSVDADGTVLLERTFSPDGALAVERLPVEGVTTTWQPDGSSEVRRTRPEGGPDEVVRYGVDELGRLSTIEGADGVVRYGYDGSTTRVASIDNAGAVTAYDYDGQGLLERVVDPDGYRVSFSRDSSGLPTEVDDGVQWQTFIYGVAGEVLERSSGSVVTTYTYSPAGELDREQTGAAERTFDYDDRGRLQEVADAFGSERVRYDGLGRVVAPGATQSVDDATPAARPLEPTDQTIAGVQASGGTYIDDTGNLVAFDDAGRIVAVESPAGVATREYDERGNLIRLSFPDGRTYVVERSDAGRPLAVTDRDGDRLELTWHGGRLTGLVTFAGVDVRYRWNDGGQLAGVDVGPMSWSYTYDRHGHVERVMTPHGEVRFEWTPEGLPLTRTAPSGAATVYEWAEDLLQRVMTDGDELLAIEWDEAGRITHVDTDDVDETFEYDDAGRLARHRYDGSDTSYTYDEEGRVIGVEQGSVSESWTWSDGTVAEVRTGDDDDDAYALSWLLPGQLQVIERAGVPIADFDFAAGGRLVAASVRDDGAMLPVGAMEWSPDGQPESVEIGDDRAELAYDADGNIVAVDIGDSTFAATFEDGAPTEIAVGERTLGFAYSGGVVSTSTYSNGDHTTELAWDGGDRVASFESSEGAGSFSYFADGRVDEIAYDDRVRPVSYDDDGTAHADGTGGELLSDLFGTDGRFAALPDDALVEPSLAALASLPPDLGIEIPRVTDPAEYLDAFLSAHLPMAPEPLIGDRSADELARQTLLSAAGLTSLAVVTGPATAAQINVRPDDPDVLEELVDGTVAVRVAERVLDRLGPDARVLDRVTGAGQSAVGELGSTFHTAWRFIRDNPVTAAVLTLTFLVSTFLAVPAVATSALSAFAFVDPTDLIGSVTALVLEPIVAVRHFFQDPNLADALIVGATAVSLVPWVRAAWGRSSCSFSRVVCVSRSRFGEAAQHIDDAIESGRPRFLVAEASAAAARRSDALRGWSRVPGFDLDEYPPAFTRQGGTGASVRAIDPSANRALGAYMRSQLPRVDGYRFLVRVVA
ncbi:NucA/NucB deoxyribonuclease domain-containing protein [Desertimonas flava]|uniref:NucA/NucB deoxyribonuclease domain-containing protein n=1 Tax=Desertimonas flava TaxID=2064846 RepID=UPI0013C4BEC9|nr:NucA/NucB deoxyribonuclease domain-containing protein [Desertimonas flava]